MNNIRYIYPKYFNILEENGIPQFLACKNIPINFNKSDSTVNLWKKHQKIMKNPTVFDTVPEISLLDLKIELSDRIFQNCIFCERRCHIDRRKNAGNCNVNKAKIASEFVHMGEEELLIPSYTIFFSGCTFHCVFCQNWDISQTNNGVTISPKILAEFIRKRKNQGAKNINWVGGDPTSNLPFILKVLKECDVNISQVWNSNMYCSTETMDLLKGMFDLFLTDFKYGNDKCAKRLSKVNNYMEIVKRNHKIAYNQSEIIIRHLVLPNHIECCTKPILHWIKNNTPNAAVNIMSQYHPEYHANEYEDIAKPLSREEYSKAKEFAEKLNLFLV